MEESSENKIKKAAEMVWMISYVLVVIGVIAGTWSIVSLSYYPTFGKGLVAFIACAVIGGVGLLIAYVMKILLEGYADLVSDKDSTDFGE